MEEGVAEMVEEQRWWITTRKLISRHSQAFDLTVVVTA